MTGRVSIPARSARASASSVQLTLRLCVDLGGSARSDIRLGAALRVDEMRSKESVDEGRLAETGLT